ncbi:MAG TPA: contact-dependent growth inhibition system immunity protein [Jatrophihabitans sp.]|nr:contact-dependent growth inhibition system immunity protein [Jatrophihabitans sp.]
MTTFEKSRWPALQILALAYLNEEWPENFRSAAEAVDAFYRNNGQQRGLVTAEISEVLAEYAESQLPELFEELDLLVDPSLDLNTYTGWLQGVARRRPIEQSENEESRLPPTLTTGLTALTGLARCFDPGWRRRNYSCTRLVVDEHVRRFPALAATLPAEIELLLARFGEAELTDVLLTAGIDYSPARELNTNRRWLQLVAQRVRELIQKQG